MSNTVIVEETMFRKIYLAVAEEMTGENGVTARCNRKRTKIRVEKPVYNKIGIVEVFEVDRRIIVTSFKCTNDDLMKSIAERIYMRVNAGKIVCALWSVKLVLS